MRNRQGFSDESVLAAFRELQQPFGKRSPLWVESSIIALAVHGTVHSSTIAGVETTLRRLKREKIVQRKFIRRSAYYSLTKSARDKYLEE